jgi:hypothetical protein
MAEISELVLILSAYYYSTDNIKNVDKIEDVILTEKEVLIC